MPVCGSCGYSSIDDSASYCPRCGEALVAEGDAGSAWDVVAEAGTAEARPPINKKESSNEVKKEKDTLSDNERKQEEKKVKGSGWGWSSNPGQVEFFLNNSDVTQKKKEERTEITGWLVLPWCHVYLGALLAVFYPIYISGKAYRTLSWSWPHLSISTQSFVAFLIISAILLAIGFVYVARCFGGRLAKTPKYIVRLFWFVFLHGLLITIWSNFVDARLGLRPMGLAGDAFKDLLFAIFYTIAFDGSERIRKTFNK